MSSEIDRTKKPVILAGLREQAQEFTDVIDMVDEKEFVLTDSMKFIAVISSTHDTAHFVRLAWCDTVVTQEQRLALQYTNNLDSIAEYRGNESVYVCLEIVFATLNCIRKGLNASKCHFVQHVNNVMAIYMAIENSHTEKS